MTQKVDIWLYDSVSEAGEKATSQVSTLFNTPQPTLPRGEGAEDRYLDYIESNLDEIIDRYCRRVGEIFDIKPDAHTVAIIAFESDRVRILLRDALISYSGTRAGKARNEEVIKKITDDLSTLNDLLLQKLGKKQAVQSAAQRDGKPVPSSAWTGEKSPREVAAVIRYVAPSVLHGLGDLIDAIEAKRFNEEDVKKTLDEARMLHGALGDLLERVESGERLESLLGRFEHFRICALNVLSNRWAFFAASPVLTMGTVSALHGMSAQSFDGGAIATIWGGWVAAKLVSERR